jgi:Xaa-Pro aminopeptidase
VRMKQTALLTGPYDWDPALLPPAEFDARLVAVRRVLAEHRATALLVHGHSAEYGALAYLTGFVPKLGPAFALVPNDGPLRVLVSGGPTLLASAKLLTWVDDVRAFGDLGNAIRDWLTDLAPVRYVVLGLWGDRAMARRSYMVLAGAAQSFGKLIELAEPLDALRRIKSARERELLGRASRILAASSRTFARTAADGRGARSAALAAERAAFALGAQDVGILASARDGGPPLPFDGPVDLPADPLLACLTVRFAGYWAEGLITISSTRHGALARAEASLSAMLEEARAGARSSALARAAAKHLSPYRIHSIVEHEIGNSIGLSLEESRGLGRDESSQLEAGGVYTLRSGAVGEGGDSAIVSAMIAVERAGVEVLWSAINPSGDDRVGAGLE